jgi:purine-cytosine permease-like protein
VFDPNLTQRIVSGAKKRVIPRNQWASRAKDYSTIALGLSAAIVAAWTTLPADWIAFLPTEWVAKGTGMLSLAGLVGKFLTQPGD